MGMPVCVQLRHILGNPAVHQWQLQLHRCSTAASPTNCRDGAGNEARRDNARTPLPFMAADGSSALAFALPLRGQPLAAVFSSNAIVTACSGSLGH